MNGLQLLPSLQPTLLERPTLNMVRSQRVFCCDDKDLPGVFRGPTMRDLFRLCKEARAFIGTDNRVFVTRKNIMPPVGLKRVAVEELFLSMELPEVKVAICDFLVNEALPVMKQEEAEALSLDFLIQLERILGLEVVEGAQSRFNFRTLRHRVCTRKLSLKECNEVQNAWPEYMNLLAVFQEYNRLEHIV